MNIIEIAKEARLIDGEGTPFSYKDKNQFFIDLTKFAELVLKAQVSEPIGEVVGIEIYGTGFMQADVTVKFLGVSSLKLGDKLYTTPQPAPEDFCYCDSEVSLQMVSGGAAKEGYLGKVTIKVNGEYVNYVKEQPADGYQLMPKLVKGKCCYGGLKTKEQCESCSCWKPNEPIDAHNTLIEPWSSKCQSSWVSHTLNGIKITYLPLNLVVTEDSNRSPHANKQIALEKLKAMLEAASEKAQQEEFNNSEYDIGN